MFPPPTPFFRAGSRQRCSGLRANESPFGLGLL